MQNVIEYKDARLIVIEYYTDERKLNDHFVDMLIINRRKDEKKVKELIREKVKEKVKVLLQEHAISEDDLVYTKVWATDYFLPHSWEDLHMVSISLLYSNSYFN